MCKISVYKKLMLTRSGRRSSGSSHTVGWRRAPEWLVGSRTPQLSACRTTRGDAATHVGTVRICRCLWRQQLRWRTITLQ